MSHLGLGIQGSREDRHEELMLPFEALDRRNEAQYIDAAEFIVANPSPVVASESLPVILTSPNNADTAEVGIVGDQSWAGQATASYTVYDIESATALELQEAIAYNPAKVRNFYDEDNDFLYGEAKLKGWFETLPKSGDNAESSFITFGAEEIIEGKEFSPITPIRAHFKHKFLEKRVARLDSVAARFRTAASDPFLNLRIALQSGE